MRGVREKGEREGIKESNRRLKMIKAHHILVGKCHNETSYYVQLIYTNQYCLPLLIYF
jgi:hypothetical protein